MSPELHTEGHRPDYHDGATIAWNLLERGKTGAAQALFRSTLERMPDHPAALWGLARLLSDSAPAEALALLDRLTGLQPALPAVHAKRGMLLQRARRGVEALEAFAAALCLAPGDSDALYNVGLCLSELYCPAQAEDIARLLMERRPDWPAARYLLVKAQVGLERDPADIDRQFALLVKQDPTRVELRYARGLLRLKMGDHAHGWDAQEWRWEIEPVKSSVRDMGRPRWCGQPLHGRRLLVVAEQGFGDILQFARFLPQAVASGAGWVGLQLEPNRLPLQRLLATLPGIEIVGPDVHPSRYDVHCPLASLPYVLDTTPDTLPSARYVTLAPADVQAWRSRLADLPRPWVGVCWAGSPDHFHDIRRTLPLARSCRLFAERQAREERIGAAAAQVARALQRPSLEAVGQQDAAPAGATMEPLWRGAAGTLVSLQVGPRAADLLELPPALRQRFVAPLDPASDFYDTACLLSLLDDVLTVDTSVAHLAGIAASRALVIKPAAPEWRWTERQGRSLWYPSVRLMEAVELGEDEDAGAPAQESSVGPA